MYRACPRPKHHKRGTGICYGRVIRFRKWQFKECILWWVHLEFVVVKWVHVMVLVQCVNRYRNLCSPSKALRITKRIAQMLVHTTNRSKNARITPFCAEGSHTYCNDGVFFQGSPCIICKNWKSKLDHAKPAPNALFTEVAESCPTVPNTLKNCSWDGMCSC